MLTLVLSMALVGQAPQAKAVPPRFAASARDVVIPKRPVSQPARTAPTRREKRARAYAATLRQEAADQAAMVRAHQQAEAQAMRMLPYQLEAQRMMLQRQSEMERNAALHRTSGALERMSGLYTPYNSGLPVRSPQIAPHMAN